MDAMREQPHESGGAKAYKSVVYPAVGLKRCIENASEIEAKYGTARLERRVAAQLLGYTVSEKGLHGTATKTLTAMIAFGLLEGAGRGSIRVTAEAKRVLYPASSDEKVAALKSLVFRPPLYAMIRERFDGAEVVPQEGVVAFLMQEDYEPRYVRAAARYYVEAVQYLREEAGQASDAGGSGVGGTSPPPPERTNGPAEPSKGEVSLVVQASQGGFPAITIQLPNNGVIVGSRELGNLVNVLQAYQPVLKAVESEGSEEDV
ncbi:MAG: hypothetical protein OXH15_18940 [Gammaproteobacteria bacterium]|nr:hypothetical protein [Gammaproteobacteria bacterium]